MDECAKDNVKFKDIGTKGKFSGAFCSKCKAAPFTNHLNIGRGLYCMQTCEWIPLPLLKVCHFTSLFLFVQWKHFQRKLKQDVTLFFTGLVQEARFSWQQNEKLLSYHIYTESVKKYFLSPFCLLETYLQTCFGHSAHI